MLKCKAHPFPEPQRHACMSTSGKTAATLAGNTRGCSLLNLLRRKETFDRIKKKTQTLAGSVVVQTHAWIYGHISDTVCVSAHERRRSCFVKTHKHVVGFLMIQCCVSSMSLFLTWACWVDFTPRVLSPRPWRRMKVASWSPHFGTPHPPDDPVEIIMFWEDFFAAHFRSTNTRFYRRKWWASVAERQQILWQQPWRMFFFSLSLPPTTGGFTCMFSPMCLLFLPNSSLFLPPLLSLFSSSPSWQEDGNHRDC